MMKALDRKLLRDLMRMWTQALAIAMVVASGMALFVATVTTSRSLRLSEDRYYEDQRFAHIWASLARAPLSVVREISALPGVAAAEGRVVSEAILDVPGVAEPATALLVSIPVTAGHSLNDLHIRRGRHPEPGQAGEVLVGEAFAEKNGLEPGDVIPAVTAGRQVNLRIVGVALSPEFVMQLPPGSLFPDDRRFGVFWMAQDELASLLDLRGALNDVAVRLSREASEAAVIRELDRILEPYGSRGAFGRASQVSHVQLEEHIRQLEALAVLVPSIFLVVAAFLVNVVLSRLVGIQRPQVGMLKAFGYPNFRIALHYLEFAFAVVVLGVLVGLPIGVWLGRLMAEFYATFFRFPVLVFRLEGSIVAVGASAMIVSATFGASSALRNVTRLPPVVAMSSAAPIYRPTLLDTLGIPQWLAPATRMITRNIARRPLRAALTTAGMSLAVTVLVLGGSSVDAINRTIDVQFHAAQREDMSVVLAHTRSLEGQRDFETLPGVRQAEPYRAIQARVHVGTHAQDAVLLGLTPDATLRRIVDVSFRRVRVPSDGVLVSAWLAKQLGIHRSEPLTIEIRDGQHRVVSPRVVGIVDEALGAFVYVDLRSLGRLLDEPDRFSAVNLLIDPMRQLDLYATLKRAPAVLTVQMRRGSLANFRAMSDMSLQFIQRICVVFSAIIAFGVVYNGARIALAERSYELATFRVLGFTRGEISAILLGEIGLLALPALPLGFGLGFVLSAWVNTAMSSERFRMPIVVEPGTYAFAVIVFSAAALCSALLVRRRLDRLDLVAVLKARE